MRPDRSRPATDKPDVVYLWVDGSDPQWREMRHIQAQAQAASLGWRYANVEGRFRDNDELRYSLRALSEHLPELGTIYLVTDNQRPKWLIDHPQLRLVSHYDLRGDAPPTYSSRCLEASLHLIPGLVDRFLYLNDDVFLGPHFKVEDFFQPGGRQFIHFERKDDAGAPGEPHRTAADVSRLLLISALTGYSHHEAPFAHAPRAIYTSAMRKLEHAFPAAFEITRSEVFRRPHTPSVLADLYPRWMHALGHADIGRLDHYLISSGDEALADRLCAWQTDLAKLSFFCVNDTLDDAPATHPALARVRAALQQAYPHPSPFEG